MSAAAQDADDAVHSPEGALWRAAVLPGWGQVYNRQYYKLPFVYGGLAGVGYLAWSNHQSYTLYREAYWYAEPRLWTDGSPDYPEFESAYKRFLAREGLPPDHELSPQEAAARRQRLAPGLRRIRDDLRRNRDLLTIGVGLFYGLTILDAYVSAHLLDFDVGEDLAVRVGASPAGMHASVSVAF
ncbi:MAG: DUF5683 domain-containing protein [Rhodothermales bacterium]